MRWRARIESRFVVVYSIFRALEHWGVQDSVFYGISDERPWTTAERRFVLLVIASY